MARYVVKSKGAGAAGWKAAAAVVAIMEAGGMLALAKFLPEIGAGAWVELERSAEEIAEESARAMCSLAIEAASKSSALAVRSASMFPAIVPCECF